MYNKQEKQKLTGSHLKQANILTFFVKLSSQLSVSGILHNMCTHTYKHTHTHTLHHNHSLHWLWLSSKWGAFFVSEMFQQMTPVFTDFW